MRCPAHLIRAGLLVVLLLTSTVMAQSGVNQSSATRVRFSKAFIVDDRLAALRREPDIQSLIIHRLRLARPVYIIEPKQLRGNGVKFYRIAVTRRTRGWIHEAAIAVPGRAGDDERIFKLIESANDGLDRITLCKLFIEQFNRSQFTPRVLLRMAEEAEHAAVALSQRARRRLDDLNAANANASSRDYYLNDSGLDRYNRLRVVFNFNEATAEYVYDGRAYREILRRFPASEEAKVASERLELMEKKLARRH
ncbi:MAG TPA: hypothetical protein VNN73_23910 [Blastocatellia bacterium]|nr:hypothetical protein [Blastocatellia bacterium]